MRRTQSIVIWYSKYHEGGGGPEGPYKNEGAGEKIKGKGKKLKLHRKWVKLNLILFCRQRSEVGHRW